MASVDNRIFNDCDTGIMPPKRKKLKSQREFLEESPKKLPYVDVEIAPDSFERKELKPSKSCSNTKFPKLSSKTPKSGECSKKQIEKKKNSQSNVPLHQAKNKRRGSTSSEIVHGPSPSKPKTTKNSSAQLVLFPNRLLTINDDESSHVDFEEIDTHMAYPPFPAVGDEIAIKCLAEPPHPEGWYAAVVLDVILHEQENVNKAPSAKLKESSLDFTLHVEWDGGGVEELKNPDWRMKGDEPDKHGRISHRDAKLRPYFRYWVNRLNSMSESEQKLNQIRHGKSIRHNPNRKVEWIQCANPNCGKWRPLPFYLKSSSVLQSCNNTWFCVLNSWDDATASCGAPQETGYMSISSLKPSR